MDRRRFKLFAARRWRGRAAFAADFWVWEDGEPQAWEDGETIQIEEGS